VDANTGGEPGAGNTDRALAAGEVHITYREAEVLELLVRGLTNREIATRLTLSPFTVKRHVGRLLSRTSLRRRIDLALWYSRRRAGAVAETPLSWRI